MVSHSFDSRLQDWLADRPTKIQKLGRGIKALWYAGTAFRFRWWGLLHFVAKGAMASSGPSVAYAMGGKIAFSVVFAASIAIFLGHAFVSFFDRMSQAKTNADEENIIDIATRLGEVLSAMESSSTSSSEKDDSIRSALGAIEVVARTLTRAPKGGIGVSLVTYNGNHSAEMKLRHRNPGSDRPSGKKFSTAFLLGHHACQAGTDPRVVHDLKMFGPQASKSPTNSRSSYRSMFLVPVVRRVNKKSTPLGFISIDASKPFAFYGSRADRVIVACEPIFAHIQDLLQGDPDVRRTS